MKYIKLAYKNGKIKEFFESESEKLIRAEYSEVAEKEIFRNMLTDTDRAIAYAKRVNEIKAAVKAEISSVLGFDVDVGFSPVSAANGVSDRIDSLETTTGELSEALNMILEGVTE